MNAHDLRRRREAAGVTQKQLGGRANIAQPHISQMEAGTRAIGERTRRRLEYALAALEADQQARRRLIEACVNRAFARPELVAMRAQHDAMQFDN